MPRAPCGPLQSEVMRIIAGALDGDQQKVRAYADLLADKLAAGGQENSARWIRSLLAGDRATVKALDLSGITRAVLRDIPRERDRQGL